MPMIVNTAWLMEYLEPQCSHEEILEALPRVGLEVEERHALGKELEGVRVGFVREKKPLEGNEGYWLCQIEVQRGKIVPIVCASEHEVRVGWGVPVASPGLILPTGREIKDLARGVRSEGMICLDGEMGMLCRDTGMHHWTDEAALGSPLTKVTPVPEYLVTVNVLPNRPDFLGVVGIAREVAALLRLKLRYPKVAPLKPATGGPVAVEIRERELCPRYSCALIRGVKVAPSAPWLKARLILAGLRPINNVVDVTNYVLYEYGQPLHAFDFDHLRGSRIVVRRMQPGESLRLLTGKVLTAGDKGMPNLPLVIADGERPVALAGVMGGSDAETNAQTTNVLLEAAFFDPVNIRKTAREVDLGKESRGTDSSYRFERGTDPNAMLEGALARATQLITDLAGGTVAAVVDDYPKRIEPRTFRMDAARTSSYLGMPVAADTIRDCLTRLEMSVSDQLDVKVPTWRSDANDPVVLIEDVARLQRDPADPKHMGYDLIPDAPQPVRPSAGVRSRTDRLKIAVADYLVSAGFFECRSPSLEPPDTAPWMGSNPPVNVVRNAQSKEMSVLRRTLLPGLARAADHNIRHGADSIRLFEIDRAFEPTTPADAGKPDPDLGRWRVAGIVGGPAAESNWQGGATSVVDFFATKGLVEDLLESVRCRQATMRPADAGALVKGRSAEVLVGTGEQPAGFIGELDISAFKFERVPFKMYAFELELTALEGAITAQPAYQPIPRVPPVTRDLAIVVKASVMYADIEGAIRKAAGPELHQLTLVDRYQGSQVPQGHQSLAFRLVFRDPHKTLRAEQVAASIDQVVAKLKELFGAELRA